MNKTFKVVFNKVRGAMTVVNEVTSCVQAKGTKTVLAAAAAMLITGSACATETNEAVENGGAINNDTYLVVKDGTEFIGHSSTSMGGAVFNSGESAVISFGENILFKDNTSANGGALFNSSSKSATIADSAQFIGNQAQYAGAIYNHISTLTIGDNLLMQGNKTTTEASAGAIANDNSGVISIGNNAQFIGNESGKSGGAIYQYVTAQFEDGDSSFTIGDNALFKENKAAANGGAAAVYSANGFSGTVTFGKNAVFESNEAVKGGAIHNEDKVVVEAGAQFVKNTSTEYGGAVSNVYANAEISFGEGVLFKENSSVTGGALFNSYAKSATIADGAQFIGNHAEYAGAIYNHVSTLTIGDNLLVKDNYTTDGSAGAIANDNSGVISIGNNAQFIGNESAKSGGAIYQYVTAQFEGEDSSFTIGDNALFKENKAAANGGAAAVYSANGFSGTVTFGKNAVFESNEAVKGGAIHNEDKVVVEAGAQFVKNTSTEYGGAVSNVYANAEISFGEGVLFKENSSVTGGALFNSYAKSATIADGAQFIGNHAEYAGAIYNHASTLTIGDNLLVKDNYTTEGSAGAIANDNSGVISIGNNAQFIGNESAKSGGAIYQYVTAQLEDGESSFNIGDNALFEGNTAAANGGAAAVYNENSIQSTMSFGNGAVFKDNSAQGLGGAIYVAADNTVVFNGNATFSGNMANGKLNDIHNDGIVNVKSGTLSLDGGITGTGSLTFADGSALNVKVGSSQEDSTTITNTISVGTDVALSMTFAPGYEGTYNLVSDSASITGENDFDLVSNSIFNIEGEKGQYTISLKDTAEIAQNTGADGNQAAAIRALMRSAGGNARFAAIATSIGEGLQSANAADKQAALDAVTVMSPETAPMVTQVQTDTTAQVFGTIGSRLASSQKKGSGLWVQGMVGATDLDDTSKAHGYTADSNGFALGLDAKPTDSTTVGLGFAYTNTDVDGFLRSTDVDNYTAFLYGEYKPSNWFVNGILSYAWANYDEDKSVAGYGVGAKYDADTLGMQLMGGLDLEVSGFTMTPEAGLRYYHVSTDSYTDGMGSSVDGTDEDILTGVIGARFAKSFEVSPAVTFVPQVRLAMTYDLVDADNTSFVTLANGSSYSVDGETLDRFGFEAGVGVKAAMGENFEMSLSYEGAWRGDYQNHAGILNAMYKF